MKTNTSRRARTVKGSDQSKTEYLEMRLGATEKQTFREAADISGLTLSAWIRERLRRVATKELEEAGRKVSW